MTVIEIRRCAGLLIVLALLGGCATSRAPSYYTLTPTSAERDGSGAIAASIGPFTLPEYLHRPQMVTRTAGAEIRLEEFHRWAENLDNAFVRTLTVDVARQLGSDRVFEFAAQGMPEPALRVQGMVQRFDVGEDGTAVLEVQWTVSMRGTSPEGGGYRSRYESAAAAADDYAARADAQSDVVAQFAADIAAALERSSRSNAARAAPSD